MKNVIVIEINYRKIIKTMKNIVVIEINYRFETKNENETNHRFETKNENEIIAKNFQFFQILQFQSCHIFFLFHDQKSCFRCLTFNLFIKIRSTIQSN